MKKALIWLLLFTTLISGASAVTTVVEPATGDVQSGIVTLNASITDSLLGNTTIDEFWAVWEAISSSTANSSWSVVANQSNKSYHKDISYQDLVDTEGGFNTTFNTGIVGGGGSALEDASDYQYRVTFYNATGGIMGSTSSAVTGVIVDNTVPIIESISISDSDTLSKDDSVTASVPDANSTGDVLIYFGPQSWTMSRSGDTLSFTVDRGKPADAIYEVKFKASDGRNVTEKLVNWVKVAAYPSGGGGIGDVEIPTSEAEGLLGMGGLSFGEKVVLIAVAAFFVINALGGKKRRR